jgi:hypothetical protein
MNDHVEQAKNQYELQQLASKIQSDLGLSCHFLPQSPEIPVHSLLVELQADKHGRPRVATLMFIPLEGAGVESLKLLQFYCEMPIQTDSQQAPTVATLLSAVNLNVPIGTFCLNAENEVTCRYVYALGKFTAIAPKEFLETFLLWMFAIDSMSPLIESVALGTTTLQVALSHLGE